jgi:hypothetical protein
VGRVVTDTNKKPTRRPAFSQSSKAYFFSVVVVVVELLPAGGVVVSVEVDDVEELAGGVTVVVLDEVAGVEGVGDDSTAAGGITVVFSSRLLQATSPRASNDAINRVFFIILSLEY